MALDSWLPIGYSVSAGVFLSSVIADGGTWQIYQARGDAGRVLLAREELVDRWVAGGHLQASLFKRLQYGDQVLFALYSDAARTLFPLIGCRSPDTKSEALACALAFRKTRSIDQESPLHDAIYVERYSCLLPSYSLSPPIPDDFVFGTFLTGGVRVSCLATRRLETLMGWLAPEGISEIVAAAGIMPRRDDECGSQVRGAQDRTFSLPGRPGLEGFFREHIIDIVENHERYKALGIDFPAAVVLHGPPGCGKTFAVERLVEHLGWPSYEIDLSSVGSPYIHETGRKISGMFEEAAAHAPAVLVIDEMETFLSDRQIGAGSGTHRVEEVGEFLRRIPRALKDHVLVIAMTNRLEMIDSAVLRRGRFDHVIEVGLPSLAEIRALLVKLVSELPHDDDLDIEAVAASLVGQPLSDVAFVIREAARLAARSGYSKLDRRSLEKAARTTPKRGGESATASVIGFVRP